MKYLFIVITSFFYLESKSQQSILKGIVSIQNSELNTGKRMFVRNAQVEDDFEKAQPTLTDINGDSMQIRIWVTYTRKDTFQIFSIKNYHNKWSGEYCEAALHYSVDHDSLLYYSKTEKHLNPKSDWQLFIDSLFEFH